MYSNKLAVRSCHTEEKEKERGKGPIFVFTNILQETKEWLKLDYVSKSIKLKVSNLEQLAISVSSFCSRAVQEQESHVYVLIFPVQSVYCMCFFLQPESCQWCGQWRDQLRGGFDRSCF
jgi:hypothetical protein